MPIYGKTKHCIPPCSRRIPSLSINNLGKWQTESGHLPCLHYTEKDEGGEGGEHSRSYIYDLFTTFLKISNNHLFISCGIDQTASLNLKMSISGISIDITL